MNSLEQSYKGSVTILMAEDDPDDRLLVARAFQELRVEAILRFVENGEELIHYLFGIGKHADAEASPRPGLILLDLNMPKKNGREALKEIRSTPNFKELPIVIWTTSNHKADKAFCLKAGASSYIVKPYSYAELIKTMRDVVMQWLPPPDYPELT
jgi:CheY-like chemotaxis protein